MDDDYDFCYGISEDTILPILLSSLSTTEVCLMFLIQKCGPDIRYKSRSCKMKVNVNVDLCEQCKNLLNNLIHFHHVYLKQSCSQFSSAAKSLLLGVDNLKTINDDDENKVNQSSIADVAKPVATNIQTFENQEDNINILKNKPKQLVLNQITDKEGVSNDTDLRNNMAGNDNRIFNLKKARINTYKEEYFSCDYCGELLRNTVEYEKHKEAIHFQSSLTNVTKDIDNVMGDETESDSKLHIKESISSRIDLDEERFTCDECGEVLKSKVVYYKHKKKNSL